MTKFCEIKWLITKSYERLAVCNHYKIACLKLSYIFIIFKHTSLLGKIGIRSAPWNVKL
jgi:hypothetical protein